MDGVVDPLGDLRKSGAHRIEVSPMHHDRGHGRDRGDRSGPSITLHERDLPEEVARSELDQAFAIARDLHVPLKQGEELVREPALPQQRVPGRKVDRVGPPRDPLAILVAEIGEQGDLLEVVCVHGRIVPRVSTWAPPAPC